MKTCIILAGGPSLTAAQIEHARASCYFTIVVNATFRQAPWAHALYAGDFLFWKVYIAEIRKAFKGKLWTQDKAAAERWQLNKVRGLERDGVSAIDGTIHNNGNSGAQAINLAYIWGFRRIILLGFDMALGPNGERHHHADHPHPLVQGQCFDEWLHKMKKVALDLHRFGIDVVNCSPGSAMRCFPTGVLEDEVRV